MLQLHRPLRRMRREKQDQGPGVGGSGGSSRGKDIAGEDSSAGGGEDALSMFICMNHSQVEHQSETGFIVTEVVGWVWTQPKASRAKFFLSL